MTKLYYGESACPVKNRYVISSCEEINGTYNFITPIYKYVRYATAMKYKRHPGFFRYQFNVFFWYHLLLYCNRYFKF